MTNLSDLIASPDGSRLRREARHAEAFIRRARLTIWWERVWPKLWPASGIVGAFVAAGLFNLFAYVPWWIHTLLLLGAAGAAGYFLYRNFQNFDAPTWYEGARRVERDSTLEHRPITEHHDVMAAGVGDAYAEALWKAHIRALLSRIGKLRVSLPSPQLAKRDPYAIRFLILLLLIGGVIVAGSDWKNRLAFALTPDAGSGTASATVDAWINPPAYTGLPPIYLKPGPMNGAPIRVPVNSELVVRVHRSSVSPEIVLSPSHDKRPKVTGADDEYAANTKLHADENIFVRAGGRTLGSWRTVIVPDEAPHIVFSEPPSRTQHDAVKIAFSAADDYGVVSARALIKPVKGTRVLSIDLPLDVSAKTVKQTVYRDLTENPLAGMDVTITLEAKDGAGQTARSKPMRFTLPARIFTNPLARALVEQRQHLFAKTPHAKPVTLATLNALTLAPDKFYQDQQRLYLVLRSTYWMLHEAHSEHDIEQVQDLLWQTAMALEGNGAANAAAELRRVAEALAQAMEQGAPQSVIDGLMQRYQQALQRYLQAMAKNAQASNGPPPPGTKVITPDDIAKMMKLIQQLAESGSRDAAAKMLAMLQSLLENMQMSGGSGGGGQGDKAMSDAIQGMSDLIGRQRQLMDKTYREGQDAGDPKDGGAKGLSEQQGKLRDDLNAILKGLGKKGAPAAKNFGDAGKAMGQAQGQLGGKDFDGANKSQQRALEDLQKGTAALAQALMQEQGGPGMKSGSQSGNEDPLGRESGAQGSINGGKVPDKDSIARAREILKELRKRAGETGRSKEELDYLDRLLKEF
ncbi:MAG: TIGR02302 family protein [Proteobacteria bacterium]|nr:TIGR02302 family protein [Pseudomonadota bacterium]